MNIIVIYNSKTGFTKKYAMWISEELQCDVCALEDANEEQLQPYGLVIFGGGILAGKIRGVEKCKELLKNSKKEVVLFATGAMPMESVNIDEMKTNNNLSMDARLFYFQSGLNYDAMKWGSRTILRVMSSILKKKKDKTETDQGTIDMVSQSSDYTDIARIVPLIESVSINFCSQ